MLGTLIKQCSVDIFLIDWEIPKLTTVDSDAEAGSRRAVSVWRKLFVANEWNDLQVSNV
jgi:hypothetical protein